jgi:mycothiol system anti-sigma-R factor
MDCIDCIETAARLHLYIDRELSTEEIAIVQQHLATCNICECRFHVDVSVKRLIHERCAFERAPEHLREAVLRLARTPVGEATVVDFELEMGIRNDLK